MTYPKTLLSAMRKVNTTNDPAQSTTLTWDERYALDSYIMLLEVHLGYDGKQKALELHRIAMELRDAH